MMKLIDIREGMRFGMGVDSVSEMARGAALAFDAVSTDAGGQKVTATVRKIESQEALLEAMRISVAVSAQFAAFSGDAKMDFASEHAVNEYSLYMLLTAQVQNPRRFMQNPRLTPEAAQLYARDPSEFREVYGDTYIDEIYSGGEFYGLFILHTKDESTRTSLSASLDASYGTMFAGGEIDASFKTSVEQASKTASMEIRAFRSGGAGVKNPTNLEELQALYAEFSQQVLAHPVDFQANLKEFRYLPLPVGPTWAEQLVRRETIESCGRYVIDGMKLRSKIDYILDNPKQFSGVAQEQSGLEAARKRVNELIPGWADRARQCARDVSQCRLDGLEPVSVASWPARIETADPLDQKWKQVMRTGGPEVGAFDLAFHPRGSSPDGWEYAAGPRGGRYWIFRNGSVPTGGIFWHPDAGAWIVYGDIFAEYLRRGHCEGLLGYPKSDEETLQPEYFGDGLDRVSFFEHGALWWDAQTRQISDSLQSKLKTEVLMRATTPQAVNIQRVLNR